MQRVSYFDDSDDEEIDEEKIFAEFSKTVLQPENSFPQNAAFPNTTFSDPPKIKIKPEKIAETAPLSKSTPQKIKLRIIVELIDGENVSMTHTHCKEVLAIYERNKGTMVVSEKNRPFWKIPLKNYRTVYIALTSPYNPFICVIDSLPEFVLRALISFHPAPAPLSILQKLPPHLHERLFPHQRESILYAVSRKYRTLIADEMGLGKTLQAVAIACLYGFPKKKVLVLCPNNLVGSWTDTFSQWTNISPSRMNIVTRAAEFPDNPLTIATYPTISRSDGLFTNYDFPMVIADECHEFTRQTTSLYKQVSPIINKAEAVILLSGTPSLNRPAELYTQLNFLRPDIFNSFKDYSTRYCNAGFSKTGQFEANGCSHPEELKILMETLVMIRRQKEDVLTGLPTKTREHIMLSYAPSDRMTELMEKMRVQKIGIQNGLASCKVAHRGLILEGFSMTADEKLEPVQQWFCSAKFRNIFFEQNRKCLVFGHHMKMLNGIKEWFEFRGVKSILICGSTSMNQRKRLLEEFRTNNECRVAVLGIESIATGVTLIEASVVVFTELMCVPAQHLQAEDRVHRIGQTSPVNVFYLHAPGSIDDRVWEILEKKLKVLGTIIASNTVSLD
jgi:SWI/SNF-related matrix-associated actin-dependent regulator 1 of chromatin subfamily A